MLSRGEKRAYFILQFLFEIESRKNSEVDQLLVFDDVADSFDYKNKYAIIEYISELHLTRNFRMLILTHNFDFYRTISFWVWWSLLWCGLSMARAVRSTSRP